MENCHDCNTKETAQNSKLRRLLFVRLGERHKPLLAVSLLLSAFLLACYRLQPDACAAVTVIPTWCWLIPRSS